MNQCQFKEKYFDFETKQTETYKCEEPAETELCCLHCKDCDNSKKLELFDAKLKKAVETSTPLFCIGFFLPDIRINKNLSKPAYFTKSKIASIDAKGIKFKEADFSGSVIDGIVDFTNTEFLLSDFIKTEFNDVATFRNAKFPNGVNFSGSKFQKIANFVEAKLVGPIYIGTKFQRVDFSLASVESGEFNRSKIDKNADFIGTKFFKSSFTEAEFNESADFTGSEIKKSDFVDTKFENANFSESTLNIIEFIRTIFVKLANFERAKIDNVEFIQARMNGNCNFTEAVLEGVGFGKTRFGNKSNFTKTQFYKKANFKATEFTSGIFDETIFKTKAEFNFVKFYENALFKKTTFDEVDFSNSQFGDNVVFTQSTFKGTAKFNNVLFENPKHTIFDVKDLSKVSFLNSNISEIRFGEDVSWGGTDHLTLIDEIHHTDGEERHIESVLAEYRSLRENFERRHRNEDAAKILRHEIELEKKLGRPSSEDADLDKNVLMRKIEHLDRKYFELKKLVELLEDKIQSNKNN